jgi:exonuclease SbcC
MISEMLQIRDQIEERFPDVQSVGDTILRFTKKNGRDTYAVYYIDFADDAIPDTQERLTNYQDRVVGSRYFDDSQSLQWNNYLYFVTTASRLINDDFREVKNLIERDRRYARKFVIPAEEFSAVLTPVEPTSSTSQSTDVLATWMELLADSGLAAAILSDDTMPKRLSLIESGKNKERVVILPPSQSADRVIMPFIKTLDLHEFRDFPADKHFEFGTVNLLFGANGCGKTSLLEAIELYYCGRTHRNPKAELPYRLDVKLQNDKTDIVTNDRPLKHFRDRHSSWYGRAEVKTNDLSESFARFNFLNTDAAVRLADSNGNIDDSLSKLLVGEFASKVWRDTERVLDAVKPNLRSLRSQEATIKTALDDLDSQIKQANNVPKKSDSIYLRLTELISRNMWVVADAGKMESATALIENLSELIPIAQRVSAITHAEQPVSVKKLESYVREALDKYEKVNGSLIRLEALQVDEIRLAQDMSRNREALNLVKQAQELMNAEIPTLTVELQELERRLAVTSSLILGVETSELTSIAEIGGMLPLRQYCEEVAESLRKLQDALQRARTDYDNYTKLHNLSVSLAQQIREIAARILEHSSNPDECPLCHTEFSHGELEAHMTANLDEQAELFGRSLLGKLRESEDSVRNMTTFQRVSTWLCDFCEKADLPSDISVKEAYDKVQEIETTVLETQDSVDELNRKLNGLALQGLTYAQFEDVASRLKSATRLLDVLSRESAEQLRTSVERDIENSDSSMNLLHTQIRELRQAIQIALDLESVELENHDFAVDISKFRNQIVEVETLLERLSKFSNNFSWPATEPVAELIIEAALIRDIASSLQEAANRESLADNTRTESLQRKNELEKELANLQIRIARFNDAENALSTLRNKHSLQNAMKAVLEESRANTELIFSKIHSPAEFIGIGSDWSKLVRKSTGDASNHDQESTLSEISTGQRAAYALSIFLGQNARLAGGPPVILIDDPIAHVDDLNALSFLDYLREVALTGKRQIFFATASEKLAGLFERKFDFLGPEDFRRFDLSRSI